MSWDAFVGSVWFGLLLCACGYVAGHLFPITKIKKMIGRG